MLECRHTTCLFYVLSDDSLKAMFTPSLCPNFTRYGLGITLCAGIILTWEYLFLSTVYNKRNGHYQRCCHLSLKKIYMGPTNLGKLLQWFWLWSAVRRLPIKKIEMILLILFLLHKGWIKMHLLDLICNNNRDTPEYFGFSQPILGYKQFLQLKLCVIALING